MNENYNYPKHKAYSISLHSINDIRYVGMNTNCCFRTENCTNDKIDNL